MQDADLEINGWVDRKRICIRVESLLLIKNETFSIFQRKKVAKLGAADQNFELPRTDCFGT